MVCSTVCSSADQREHQSSASLGFVRGIHRWPGIPLKRQVTRKCFHLMTSSWCKETQDKTHDFVEISSIFTFKIANQITFPVSFFMPRFHNYCESTFYSDGDAECYILWSDVGTCVDAETAKTPLKWDFIRSSVALVNDCAKIVIQYS